MCVCYSKWLFISFISYGKYNKILNGYHIFIINKYNLSQLEEITPNEQCMSLSMNE